MGIRFNKTAVDKLEPREREYREYFDGLPGFGIKVFPSGRKTYFWDYTSPVTHGRRRIKVGNAAGMSIENAKKRYAELVAQAAGGDDPLVVPQVAPQAPFLADWIEEYLDMVEPHRRSLRADRAYLGALLDGLGNVRLDEITRRDIMALHKLQRERGNHTANRWRTAVCTCFNVAVDMELIERNPAARIKGLPEEPRQRVLSDDELKKLVAALNDEDPYTGAAFRLMIHTGCRQGEILQATWGEFDLDGGWWHIPTGHAKSKKPQTIPINSAVVEILKSLEPGEPDEPVLMAPRRRPGGEKNRATLNGAWERIKKRAGLPDDLNMHDIRRTFGLRVALSHGIHVASKLLRHSSIKITERAYAPLGVEEKGQEILRAAVGS
jgi:integrase